VSRKGAHRISLHNSTRACGGAGTGKDVVLYMLWSHASFAQCRSLSRSLILARHRCLPTSMIASQTIFSEIGIFRDCYMMISEIFGDIKTAFSKGEGRVVVDSALGLCARHGVDLGGESPLRAEETREKRSRLTLGGLCICLVIRLQLPRGRGGM
jgi:hypothetical protein